MQELDDIALLREYAERDSEPAFATLVTRHIDRVYSVALRHTRNPHHAEEITQAVFVILAAKAKRLGKGVILEGWLYQTARLTALTHIRSEIRRAHREQEAYMQNVSNENESETWSQITPLLDAVLAGLNETDRNAVVLRFFYGKSMGEIGTALGANEDTARMRINRAIGKLQKFFSKRGVNSTVDAITGAISANSIQAAPAALIKTATAVALAKGATASTSTLTLIKGALKLMAWTKAKTAIVAVIIVLLAATATTVTVKEIATHQSQVWQKGFNLFVTDKVPPQTTILLSLASQSHHAAGSHNGKMLGVGQSIPDIFMNAYGMHKAQLNFSAPVPNENYDFISNLPRGQAEALQKELQRKFGLVGHRELVAVDHLVLKVKSRNAPGLRRSVLPFSGSEQDDSYSGHSQSVWSLVDYLSDHLGMVVVDQTGLSGNFDIDFTWDRTPEGLKQALLEQTGLELVPSSDPIEFLMVEDVNHPVVGIGAGLAIDEQTQQLKITSVYPNSPAAEAGLSVGSIIQKVDGISVADKSLSDCVNLLRGQAGTKVELQVAIPSEGKTNTIELVRRKIQL